MDHLTRHHTDPDAPGPRFGPEVPVAVLVSSSTFSAAEALAYDLRALGRAVVVGADTGGGAHPFERRRVGRDFVLGTVVSRSVNPITGGTWQDVGVTPDVACDPDDALTTALGLLRGEAVAPGE